MLIRFSTPSVFLAPSTSDSNLLLVRLILITSISICNGVSATTWTSYLNNLFVYEKIYSCISENSLTFDKTLSRFQTIKQGFCPVFK